MRAAGGSGPGEGQWREPKVMAAGRSREEQGGAGRSREEQGGAGRSREEQGGAGRSREEQGGAGRSREEQGVRGGDGGQGRGLRLRGSL